MRFGMSEKLGPRVFGHDHGQPFLGREFSSEPDYSDEIAREIDDEIRRIVEEAHQTARATCSSEQREKLDTTSEILLRRETIEREQFIELLEGKSEDEVFGPEEPASPGAAAGRPRGARAQARAGARAEAAAPGPGRRHRRDARRPARGPREALAPRGANPRPPSEKGQTPFVVLALDFKCT